MHKSRSCQSTKNPANIARDMRDISDSKLHPFFTTSRFVESHEAIQKSGEELDLFPQIMNIPDLFSHAHC